ncbi:coiled-coil domain-containing protein [Sphingomonas nostoxanthinifaciens]|uniref:hypothetical protein n=1 Tax=Sphingomonas nostoxanthinifaciens TaxID=2872652 RepID=UPI001CC1EB39|nr:hypothetical protein [Sphingomonas nostoxanthinifaciens]UAK26184.1 hypothetical protein K8P63_08835 [Sphingomonas nostoxanthinifaciens]
MNQGATAKDHWASESTPDETMVSVDGEAAFDQTLVHDGKRWRRAAAGIILLVAAVGWIALLAVGLATAAPPGGLAPLKLAAWVGLGSGPLALLAVLYLLIARSGAAETRRQARMSAQLRADAGLVVDALDTLNERLTVARAALQVEAEALNTLGSETGARMTRAAIDLRSEAEAFGRAAATFDDATGIARADLGVLMSDLPQAEATARMLAERLREGSSEVDGRARTLAELLAELDARARSAGEATAGAAARLAGQLDRVEMSAAAADKRIEDAALGIGRAVDIALDVAAEGVEQTRQAVSAQSAALTAMVSQGRASLGAAGDDAVKALSARLDELVSRVEGIGAGLRGQELQARGLLGQLEQAVEAVEARFASLGDKGAEHTADLAEAIVALAEHSDAIGRTLGNSSQSAETLLGRVTNLRQQSEASVATLADAIPAALARVKIHAEQSLNAIAAAHERTDGLEATASAVAARLADSTTLLERQRIALQDAGTVGEERLAALHAQAEALDTLLHQAADEARSLSEGATGQLVDALLRVRDTATQASEHARDALSAAIPRVAQRLGESAARALTTAMSDVGRDEVAAVAAASEQAVEAARSAAERLSRQLVTIAETATAIEARIEENRTETEAHDDASFARSVSLLIEALNSASIDVARLFATETSDEDWKTYLRGDRGVFTRRTLRLVERAEAQTIATRYNDEPDFRELTNRYLHDFEALLRRVMATRDGNAIATTMLSSDAGKLYVVLAQAIERLRR